MSPYRALLIAMAVFVSLLPSLTQARQDDEMLPVTPGAGRYLPKTDDLGPGWVNTWQAGIDPGADLFKEGAKSVYGGEGGSRAVVYAWVIQDSTTAVRRSWEETADFLSNQRFEWASAYDYSRAKEIDGLEPPSGCVESSRAEGANPDSQFPAGLTLCAVDPDVILLTIISGELDGKRGYLASDALVQRAFAAADAVTS